MFGGGNENKWKNKYDELRRELRTQEREWSEIEALLQRAVSRLAIAASGLDARLDAALQRIRGSVRGRIERRQLDTGLNELAEAVKRIEQANRESPANTPDSGAVQPVPAAGDLMISVLERLAIDDHHRGAFLETIDFLSRYPDRPDEIQSRVVGLLNSWLQQAPPDAAAAAGAADPTTDTPAEATANRQALASLLQSLEFSNHASGRILRGCQGSDLSLALDELTRELAPRLQQPGVTATTTTEASADSSRRLLLSLVQRLSTVQGLEQAIAGLQHRFQQPVMDQQWPQLLQALADALGQAVASIRAQKTELEAFIGQVKQQLGEFENFVRTSQDDLDSARSGRQHLSTRLGDEMQNIRANMDGVTDIDQIKRSVLGSLGTIAEQMQEFRNHEESRIAAAEARNHDLIRQIDSLHFEARRLKEQNDEQREQLMLDPLTKVNSRYAYEKRVEEEFSRWHRYRQPLSYTIWDIDRFKSINDTYGHKTGDKLLQMVARLLARNTRKSDFLARIGGEEFVILLPGTPAAEAAVIADKLRGIVADTDFHYKNHPRQITLSCGITEFREDDTVDSVYQRADEALYKAKHAGRNRCTAA